MKVYHRPPSFSNKARSCASYLGSVAFFALLVFITCLVFVDLDRRLNWGRLGAFPLHRWLRGYFW